MPCTHGVLNDPKAFDNHIIRYYIYLLRKFDVSFTITQLSPLHCGTMRLYIIIDLQMYIFYIEYLIITITGLRKRARSAAANEI